MTFSPEILFRLLADPTRLQSVMLLHAEGRLCVCELTHALQLSQPKSPATWLSSGMPVS